MGTNGPTLCPKKWLIFTNLGQGLSQKVGFFLLFEPILQAWFLTKCWLFQTRSPPLSLFLAVLAVVFHNFVQILLERSLFKLEGTLNYRNHSRRGGGGGTSTHNKRMCHFDQKSSTENPGTYLQLRPKNPGIRNARLSF